MSNMSCKSWTYPETQALLDIWQQDHIQTQLTLMARNRPVWEQVAERMNYHKGFNRTGEQCKTRIHTLKIRYNRAKKFGLSGPEAEKECPFYRQLDAVLGKNWVRKQELGNSPPSSTINSSITSLYPLTFSNDIDRMSQNGMIQILPKPIPKYMDTTAFAKVSNGGLKLPADKLEDMMGEQNKLIKRVLSSLVGDVGKVKEGATLPVVDGDEGEQQVKVEEFNEMIKSLVTTPTFELPISQDSKSSLNSPTSPQDISREDVADTTSLPPANKRRKLLLDYHEPNYTADRVLLLGSVAQITNNIIDLNNNIKHSIDQDERKMKWMMEMQEKSFVQEKEHFQRMERLFTSLFSSLSKEDVKQMRTGAASPEDSFVHQHE